MSWLCEPLVHFLALGLVVCGLQWALRPDPTDPSVIIVDAARREALSIELTEALGRPPRPEEHAQSLQTWIQTEALVREARRLGLDEGDPIIRSRLATRMALLSHAIAVPPEPTDAELQSLYARHGDDFTRPQTVTFRHVFADTAEAAARLATEWQAGTDPRELGDHMPPGGPVLRGRTPENLTERFGADFASAVNALPLETPTVVASTVGWHVVSVKRRTAGGPIPFTDARDRLRLRWQSDWLKAATEEAITAIEDQYRVVEIR